MNITQETQKGKPSKMHEVRRNKLLNLSKMMI